MKMYKMIGNFSTHDFASNQLNVMLNAELSVGDRECLDAFVRVRHQLAVDMDMSAADEDALVHYQSNEVEELSTHELLIAEVILGHILRDRIPLFAACVLGSDWITLQP
jgi:hypothetical protein